MKIRLAVNFIWIIFFIHSSHGQEYNFDKVMKSEFSTAYPPNQERMHLFNSKNDSYHMQIYSRNDSLKSRITDLYRRQVHYFDIDKSNSLRLKYLKTSSWTKKQENYTYEFSKTAYNNKIVLKIFNKKNPRIAKYRFTIKETEQNLFHVFKFSATESFRDTDIIPPFNFIVLKAIGRNLSGNIVKYEVTSIDDVDLSISIPPNN